MMTKTAEPGPIADQRRTASLAFEVAGERAVGDLHLPAGAGPFPAVLTGGPMISLKEQVTGTYAAALARRGIAALAIDNRHSGESGGQPRQYECFARKIADPQAAMDAPAARPEVDADRLGAVGVGLGAGYLAHAIAGRPAMRALVGIEGYYRDVAAMRSADPRGLDAKVAKGRTARAVYGATGEVETIPAVALDRDAAMPLQPTHEYDAACAAHPNYVNRFAVMLREHFPVFDVQSAAPPVTIPFLMLHGPNALDPAWADAFYARVAGPKRRAMIRSRGQTDIYDNPRIVADAAARAADFLLGTL